VQITSPRAKKGCAIRIHRSASDHHAQEETLKKSSANVNITPKPKPQTMTLPFFSNPRKTKGVLQGRL